jgi:hypothetical protein
MEKRLGKDENMILNKMSIVAFELTIKFSKAKFEKLNNSNLIELTGPGLVIYESSKVPVDDLMITKSRFLGIKLDLKSFIMKIVLPLFFMILFVYLEIKFDFFKEV